jgi:hypothetical protein
VVSLIISDQTLEQRANILSRVPGEHIAAALQTLPDCETTKQNLIETVYEVPLIGRVRFTCKRFRHKHGKSTTWFWTAQQAVLVE